MADARIPPARREVGHASPRPDVPGRRGRPRSEEADRAILAAATQLLAERGLGGMSMEEVAARAGVGKATVYRRWGSRGALALDAFLAEFSRQQPLPDTGTFHGDLLAALRGWIRSVTRTPAGRMLAGLVAEAQRDPALAAAWRERVFEPLRASNTILVRRAIDRAEIPAGHRRRRRARPAVRLGVPPAAARPPAADRPVRPPGGGPDRGRAEPGFVNVDLVPLQGPRRHFHAPFSRAGRPARRQAAPARPRPPGRPDRTGPTSPARSRRSRRCSGHPGRSTPRPPPGTGGR